MGSGLSVQDIRIRPTDPEQEQRMNILYEDSDVIVCHKPASIATQTARIGEKDMLSELKNYLYSTSGHDSYVGLIHRLDQGVEGILVFAKTASAAADLSRQITEHTMKKSYYAVVCGDIKQQSATLTDYLMKNGRDNLSKVVSANTKGAKRADLSYECIRSDEVRNLHVLRINLITGRHHQIRVQLAHQGLPLVNDFKYGYHGDKIGTDGIALCAYKLCFHHPVTQREMEFEIKPAAGVFLQIGE